MSTFGFGDQQSTQQTPFGGFSLGATSTPAQNLTTQPASSNALASFGGLGGMVATTSASLFGVTQPTAAPSTLFPTATAFPALGQTATSTATPGGISFGGFGNPASSSTMAFGTSSLVPASTTVTSVTPTSVGLGGVDMQASGVLNGSNASSKKEGKAVKESQIPTEITVSVESFKKYVKEQKAIREEMSRVSSKNIFKVQDLVNTLKQQLSVVSNGLHRNALAIARLKEESNQELKNAEIAQRTKDSLSSMQYENNAPTEYFHSLASAFEKQMQSYRQQIEQLERHLLSLSQPYTLSPNEWTSNRRRLHDTFVTLAAQLQAVHQEIQLYKEDFINSQKTQHGEVRVYLEHCRTTRRDVKHLPAPLSYGPSPFKAMQSDVGRAIANVYNGSQQLPGCSSLSYSSFESGAANRHLMLQLNSSRLTTFQSVSPFKPLGQAGVPSFGGSSLGVAVGFGGESQFVPDSQKPFQLQKPPAGNKRGKRWTST